jgi:hypothetical protein
MTNYTSFGFLFGRTNCRKQIESTINTLPNFLSNTHIALFANAVIGRGPFLYSAANMNSCFLSINVNCVRRLFFRWRPLEWPASPRRNLAINPELPTANACAVAPHQRLSKCSDGRLPLDPNRRRESLMEKK